MITNSKVLITGGLGSIGANLVAALRANANEILIIDDCSSNSVIQLDTQSGIRFEHCNVANSEKLGKIVRDFRPQYTFHLAAHFANQNSIDFPFSDLQTNVVGTMNLFEVVKDLGVTKVVFASSSCVYGVTQEIMSEVDHVYPYETPYAINKFMGELYASYYAHYHNVPIVSARIFNTYGPGERPGKYRNVIPNFIKQALTNDDIVITGTGEETRDFTYVGDTVQLLMLLASSRFGRGEVFNGGTGSEVGILELAKTIIRMTNSRSKLVFKERRDWDLVKRRVANIEKARKFLGYSPQTSLEDGLAKTIPWYKELLKV